MISVILPSYNEEENIQRAAEHIGRVLQTEQMDYELVFVNDGSRDATWQKIVDLARTDRHVVGVNFSRNFGKEAAILAGLAQAKGDCCAVMDCDLQHPPETLRKLTEGSKGEDVYWLQMRLKELGFYNGTVTGASNQTIRTPKRHYNGIQLLRYFTEGTGEVL